MTSQVPKTDEQLKRERELAAVIGGCLFGAITSLPALVLASLACRAVVGRRQAFAIASVVAVLWCAAFAPTWAGHMGAAWKAATGHGFGLAPDLLGVGKRDRNKRARERRTRPPRQHGNRDAQRATRHRKNGDRRDRPGRFAEAWPHLRAGWLLWLPLVFPFALVVNRVRPKELSELEAERELAERRRYRRRRRRAGRRARKLAEQPERLTLSRELIRPRRKLIALGAQFDGERFLERGARYVGMPLEWLNRHALVIGPSGSGKTETLLRLAYGAARHGWPVYYIDAKGDPAGAERFGQVMAAAGRRSYTFPDLAWDGWRGDTRAIYNRLLELVPFASEGDGSWYRDIAKQVLWIACERSEGPPRSSGELLHRLAPDQLRAADHAKALAGFDATQLAGPRARYGAFFAALGDRLDAGGSFEDYPAAYLRLDGLRLKEEADSLARLLIEDFADYAADRKPRDQHALLIVDEFSAIADAARVVELVERVRSYNVGVILAPQVEQGMGDEKASARIVQNVETVFCHALKRPESIIALAGTRREVEWSHQHQDQLTTGLGTGRAQHVYKVDPNKVRALKPGECYLLRAGQAAEIKIAQAPTEIAREVGGLPNPEPPSRYEPHDPPPERRDDQPGPLP
jgi:helicase HerA-like protein